MNGMSNNVNVAVQFLSISRTRHHVYMQDTCDLTEQVLLCLCHNDSLDIQSFLLHSHVFIDSVDLFVI